MKQLLKTEGKLLLKKVDILFNDGDGSAASGSAGGSTSISSAAHATLRRKGTFSLAELELPEEVASIMNEEDGGGTEEAVAYGEEGEGEEDEDESLPPEVAAAVEGEGDSDAEEEERQAKRKSKGR